MKKIFLTLIFLFLNFFSTVYSNEKTILIKFKVNEDLITNYDIIKEAKYLKSLSNFSIPASQNVDGNSLLECKPHERTSLSLEAPFPENKLKYDLDIAE